MKFQPPFLLKNKHIQTIYTTLFQKQITIDYTIVDIPLSDGDKLEAYCSFTKVKSTKYTILLHGLTGSYRSPYIQRAVTQLNKYGYNAIVIHFRGCSGNPNLLPRSYHSGDTQDIKEALAYIKKHYTPKHLYAIGYSLGGNVLLKLLGELQDKTPFTKAVAVSAPMKLAISSAKMGRGFSRYYQNRLLKELQTSLLVKYDMFDMEKLLKFPRNKVRQIKSFWEFDDVYTAPIHGFKDAQDYYTKSSSFNYLKTIATPTLIIHAKDDPFMTPEVIPTHNDISDSVELEVSQHGGHVGFIAGSIFKPKYWLEERIVSFFEA